MIDRATWNAALGSLEVQMSSGQFAAWLKDSHFVEGGSNRLVVGVPNAFARETIERNYRPLVADAIREVAGRDVGVTFVVAGRSEPDGSTAARNAAPAAAVAIQEPAPFTDTLEARFTFDRFIVGRGNQLAHAAARQVSENPGAAYNPLFIYGGVGLGKTHLLRAIAAAVAAARPEATILYATSEDFTNDLIAAIRGGSTPGFRGRYRSADVFLLDDVQFIAGRESTQEELFHTFDALQAQGRQIVFTSDRTPHDIKPLSDRLTTRFACGLVADIQRPDIETRIAVLRARARTVGAQVPEAVTSHLANSITRNVRDLEGALNRVLAYADFNGVDLDVAAAEYALQGLAYGPSQRVLVLDDVLEGVAQHYRVAAADLVGPSRRRGISSPRQVAMYLMRQLTSESYPTIGAALGNRDHSTILHGYQKISGQLESDTGLAAEIETIRAAVLGDR
ncbi:MAG: chromosomal replication initiator protein DnaA [Chloroflexota bacterium]|nr:chromosomal replication initiator protein DnaA [Chloroflexota bacterium]MDP6756610.1 chromosomal replication initiator protein DnaA [Chloroflexota bacterium]